MMPVEAALQPVAVVDPHHEARLIVQRGVFSHHAALQGEIAGNRQKEEVSVVGNVIIESLAPVIRFGFRGDHKLIAGLPRRCRLVEPFHLGDKRSPVKLSVRRREWRRQKALAQGHLSRKDRAGERGVEARNRRRAAFIALS
jgi:hypothetical protein